jgi:hypothetical protein
VPVPSNRFVDTAIAITTLPYSNTQQVDDSGTTYSVWYAYTPPEGVEEIGVFGFGDLVTYRPVLWVYDGDVLDPSFYFSSSNNKPAQIPVTPGVTYYLRFLPNGGNPTPANLSVSVVAAPTDPAPVGSILINDDSGPVDWSDWPTGTVFPGVVLGSDGAVLRFVHGMPSGEAGDALEDGTILLSDEFIDLDLKRYSAQLELLGSVAYAWVGVSPVINAHHTGNKWYVGSKGSGLTPASATTVLANGTLGPTTWTFPDAGLQAIAASPDETVLYLTGQATGAGAVQRWDLVNNLPLSDLGSIASYGAHDVLVLKDGSIVAHFTNAGTGDVKVRRYSAAGAVLNTYDLGAGGLTTAGRLAYAIDNPTSFWAWGHPTGASSGLSVFTNIRASDGTVLATVTSVEFEGGVYQPTATATPTARFGNSFSCPFIVLRVAVDGGGDDDDDDDEEPGEGDDACVLTTPLGCWSPGVTPLGCGPRTRSAMGCWSGSTPADRQVGLLHGTAE